MYGVLPLQRRRREAYRGGRGATHVGVRRRGREQAARGQASAADPVQPDDDAERAGEFGDCARQQRYEYGRSTRGCFLRLLGADAAGGFVEAPVPPACAPATAAGLFFQRSSSQARAQSRHPPRLQHQQNRHRLNEECISVGAKECWCGCHRSQMDKEKFTHKIFYIEYYSIFLCHHCRNGGGLQRHRFKCGRFFQLPVLKNLGQT